jgi:hypothetical protein
VFVEAIAEGVMKLKGKLFQTAVLSVGLLLVLSCTLLNSLQGESSDSSTMETNTALHGLSASLTHQQLTAESVPTETTTPFPTVQPTGTSIPPTQTSQPSPTSSETPGTPLPLVLDVQTSADTFYCYDAPFELTVLVKVSDINRGMAIFYHIQDKKSGVSSDEQVIDLHRKTSDTRSATIIGGGSDEQNLQFPPLMGESYFIYQIVSDDGNDRSPVYSNITFYPCSQ